MKRLAFPALGLALACGTTATSDPGPLGAFYKPSGVAVEAGNLLVASSNFDLQYGLDDGGTVISVNPGVSPAHLVSGVRIASYSGEMAVARAKSGTGADDCGASGLLAESVAVVAARSTQTLFPVAIGANGTLRCDGCGVSLAGGYFADPLAVGVACTDGWARAYVAYLRSIDGAGWISEYDLAGGSLRSGEVAWGPVRGFAFDRASERLWMATLATGGASRLSWVDLAGGCRIDLAQSSGGCVRGSVPTGQMPSGVEFRAIALASADSNPRADTRRAYVTGRLYDTPSAAISGGRTTDYGGLLLVVDLVESSTGGIDAQFVNEIPLGTGAAEVRVLPPRTGLRDVVAALDATSLTIYDDATGGVRTFGMDPSTGAPVLGHAPWGIGVDPDTVGGVARLYVGSFQESFVTPIDVPLLDPASACMCAAGGAPATPCSCVDAANPTPRRIHGGTP